MRRINLQSPAKYELITLPDRIRDGMVLVGECLVVGGEGEYPFKIHEIDHDLNLSGNRESRDHEM